MFEFMSLESGPGRAGRQTWHDVDVDVTGSGARRGQEDERITLSLADKQMADPQEVVRANLVLHSQTLIVTPAPNNMQMSRHAKNGSRLTPTDGQLQ